MALRLPDPSNKPTETGSCKPLAWLRLESPKYTPPFLDLFYAQRGDFWWDERGDFLGGTL